MTIDHTPNCNSDLVFYPIEKIYLKLMLLSFDSNGHLGQPFVLSALLSHHSAQADLIKEQLPVIFRESSLAADGIRCKDPQPDMKKRESLN